MGKWLDIYSNGRVYEMDGSKLVRVIDTKGEVKRLLQLLQTTDAGMYAIAPANKVPPDQTQTPLPPPPPPTERTVLRITRTDRQTASGLVILTVANTRGGKVLDQLPAIAGQPGKQVFRTVTMSRAGSMEPLPEGYWLLGPVEWASGTWGDYSKSWADANDGLGPIWVDMKCNSPTEREAIGFHLDNNGSTSPGTIGCVGFLNLTDLKRFVSWFSDPRFAPKVAIVNWGLGTVKN